MCGICGFTGNNKELLRAMNASISHRGPDGEGFFEDNGISLGHRRLKIIDLSEKGKQPMSNEDGNVLVTFNGEIYNYKPLREQLQEKGHRFNSATDTEVIVHAYEEYGEKCAELFDGMFAFALWDSKQKKLVLARDPLGKKPLYYSVVSGQIYFASEIKALLENPELRRRVNKSAVGQLLNFRAVLGKETLFDGIFKVLPGSYLVWQDGKKTERRYWQLTPKEEISNEEAAAKKFLELFDKAVEKRLMSDVPLGTYLSGGVDSSAITALMSKKVEELRTFTVGFGEEGDELSHARAIAGKFSTNHSEVIVDYKDMTKVLPKLVWHMDEPMADIAFVPMYFLTNVARNDITVSLLGEGSDELFGGYERYRKTVGIRRFLPQQIAAKGYLQTDMGFREREKNAVLSDKGCAGSLAPFLNSHFKSGNFLDNALRFDAEQILPNYQLMRVDKVTMSCGLEARAPFLDKQLAEFAFSLSPELKVKGKVGKYIVKKAFRKILPANVLDERKRIFFIPLKQWFKDSLRDVAQQLLSKEALKERGLFNYNDVRLKFFLQSRGVFQNRFANQLLMLSMIEIWHRTFIDSEKVPKNGLSLKEIGI